MLKKLLLMSLFILVSTAAKADVDETGQITRLIITGNYRVTVWLSGADVTTECSAGNTWNMSKANDMLFDEKLSMMLAAASLGQTVHLHHISSDGCGFADGNKINYVDISY